MSGKESLGKETLHVSNHAVNIEWASVFKKDSGIDMYRGEDT